MFNAPCERFIISLYLTLYLDYEEKFISNLKAHKTQERTVLNNKEKPQPNKHGIL